MNPDREEESEITRRVVITLPFQERDGGGGSELPWIAIPVLLHSLIDPQRSKWALGQCEALELEQE